jgi:hypothetical protein
VWITAELATMQRNAITAEITISWRPTLDNANHALTTARCALTMERVTLATQASTRTVQINALLAMIVASVALTRTAARSARREKLEKMAPADALITANLAPRSETENATSARQDSFKAQEKVAEELVVQATAKLVMKRTPVLSVNQISL